MIVHSICLHFVHWLLFSNFRRLFLCSTPFAYGTTDFSTVLRVCVTLCRWHDGFVCMSYIRFSFHAFASLFKFSLIVGCNNSLSPLAYGMQYSKAFHAFDALSKTSSGVVMLCHPSSNAVLCEHPWHQVYLQGQFSDHFIDSVFLLAQGCWSRFVNPCEVHLYMYMTCRWA